MKEIILGAGWFIYPLGLCSLIAFIIAFERLIILSKNKIFPDEVLHYLSENNFDGIRKRFPKTLAGKMVRFFYEENPDETALRAFLQLQITKMERGIFLLETVIVVAPLLGLFGTVYGLYALFPETGSLPEQDVLTRGVGLALTTTMLGLGIAIPALFVNNIISRKIDIFAARLSLLVEKIKDNKNA